MRGFPLWRSRICFVPDLDWPLCLLTLGVCIRLGGERQTTPRQSTPADISQKLIAFGTEVLNLRLLVLERFDRVQPRRTIRRHRTKDHADQHRRCQRDHRCLPGYRKLVRSQQANRQWDT